MTSKYSDLPSPIQRFILHWGDLGGQWGVNRSVAQIHALLYISDKPLTAEDISEILGLARSNVSNSLKELMGWNLIYRVPVMGDRREHFEAETDVWEMLRRIAHGRKEREIDPAARTLDDCVAEAKNDTKVSKVAVERLQEMQNVVNTMNQWYEQMLPVPKSSIINLIRLGAKVTQILSLGRKNKEN